MKSLEELVWGTMGTTVGIGGYYEDNGTLAFTQTDTVDN